MIWRACWHIACANSFALRLSGFDIQGKEFNVLGGVVDVDQNGPTGILRERAVEAVVSAMGAKQEVQKLKFITEGLALCLKMGLTAVQTNDESCYDVYRRMEAEGALPIRVFLTPNHSDLHKPVEVGGVLGLSPFRSTALLPQRIRQSQAEAVDKTMPLERTSHSKLTVERIKIFSDGSLGAETAALRVYDDDTTESSAYTGVLIQSRVDLQDCINSARERSFRLEIHAIGDKAAEQVSQMLSLRCRIVGRLAAILDASSYATMRCYDTTGSRRDGGCWGITGGAPDTNPLPGLHDIEYWATVAVLPEPTITELN